MEENKIQLKTSSILSVPLQIYEKDFTFFVNGEEFRTSKLIADLISPNISKIHQTDQTFDTFTINTQQKGNFLRILELSNFNQYNIPQSELPFVIEILKILGNSNIEINSPLQSTEITSENVFQLIQKHQKYPDLFSTNLSQEIDFISSSFYEICESHEDEFFKLDIDIVMRIIDNDKLQIKSEDQLLHFVNQLYRSDSKYSILFEKVFFTNVTFSMMKEFVSVFDNNDMTGETWNRICERLTEEIKQTKSLDDTKRYTIETNQRKVIPFNQDSPKSGIINYLREKSYEVDITSSSVLNESWPPQGVAFFDDQSKEFYSDDMQDGWICFDFKNHCVIPTKYTIKSYDGGRCTRHPKSWVIEGSNDKQNWTIISKEDNCEILNKPFFVHTFNVQNQNDQEFRFIRMRITGPCWNGSYSFAICSFEIYGTLI